MKAHRWHPFCRDCWTRLVMRNLDVLVAMTIAGGGTLLFLAIRNALVDR